jgi:hypothetical protein
MTKREKSIQTEKRKDKFSPIGKFDSIVAFLSLVFTLPIGETLFGEEVPVQLIASITLTISVLILLYWLYLWGYALYLEKTMKFEVYISGDISRTVPEIKIENKEPVNIEDVHVEMIRFSWNKSVWNDIDKFTIGDRFFSIGLPENRRVSRSPVYVKIAEGIKNPNITHILLDNHTRHMPLDKQGSEFSKWAKYEFVFRIMGRFADKESSESFGDYRGVLLHEQIQPHGEWAGQDIFKWEFFDRTDEKVESVLKLEREKELRFSFP